LANVRVSCFEQANKEHDDVILGKLQEIIRYDTNAILMRGSLPIYFWLDFWEVEVRGRL